MSALSAAITAPRPLPAPARCGMAIPAATLRWHRAAGRRTGRAAVARPLPCAAGRAANSMAAPAPGRRPLPASPGWRPPAPPTACSPRPCGRSSGTRGCWPRGRGCSVRRWDACPGCRRKCGRGWRRRMGRGWGCPRIRGGSSIGRKSRRALGFTGAMRGDGLRRGRRWCAGRRQSGWRHGEKRPRWRRGASRSQRPGRDVGRPGWRTTNKTPWTVRPEGRTGTWCRAGGLDQHPRGHRGTAWRCVRRWCPAYRTRGKTPWTVSTVGQSVAGLRGRKVTAARGAQ